MDDLLGCELKRSGYRCCPGLGLFTKQVPLLLGQAGKVLRTGVKTWAHRESHPGLAD